MQKSENFSFLRQNWPDLESLAAFAELYSYTDPASSLVKIRTFAEKTVDILYYELGLRKPLDALTFRDLLDGSDFKRAIPKQIIDFLHYVRKEGNKGAHELTTKQTTKTCLELLRNTHRLALWFYATVTKNPAPTKVFQEPKQSISSKELMEKLAAREERIKELEDQQLRQREEHPKEAATDSALNVALLEALEGANSIGFTEAETRKQLIDSLLTDAGWSIRDYSQYDQNSGHPQCIREYPLKHLSTTKSGEGAADYVLMGKAGLPLAVIEGKKTAEDAEIGKTQAEDYANGIEKSIGRRPFIYYTNGHDIFFWDDLAYPERKVWGFFDRDKLEYLLFQRANRSPLAQMTINTSIVDRDYQLEAIRRTYEDFEIERRRSALLVMATGTGKTRVAMAIVDGLMRANWVKRVLFLTDRLELQEQAKDAFKEHIPDATIAIVGSADDSDSEARIYLSTYPSMMNAHSTFNVGFFDLIIADESHRSIYKYYREIFQYFDALRVGLTATPVDYVTRNTFLFFGRPDRDPTFYFSLTDATSHQPPYLVDYKVENETTRFLERGIRYDDLTEEQRAQLEEQDEEAAQFDFNRDDLDKIIMNKETNRMILRNVIENGIRNEDGTRPGKTIIFARSHNHGTLMESLINELYPQYKGKFAKLIDYKDSRAKQLIKGFKGKNKQFAYIDVAISVDMLDTGIDVPEVVNLCFAKPVYSKVKFWQMLGRGTRLCRDLFGEGKDKTEFLVFDPWRNFEFFGQNPNGFVVDAESKSVPERLFSARIELLNALATNNSNEAGNFKTSDAMMLLREDIKALPQTSVTVRERWVDVERVRKNSFWERMGDEGMILLRQQIQPLMRWRNIEGEADAMSFDIKITRLQIALLSGNPDAFDSPQQRVLEDIERLRVNLNQVKEQLPLIKAVQKASWWDNVTVEKLEEIRLCLRGLMRYRSVNRIKARIIDIYDHKVASTQTIARETSMDEYRERLLAVLQDLLNTNLTLQKIKRGHAVTNTDLVTLQSLILSRMPGLDLVQLQELFPSSATSLDKFIRSLVGMDELTVRMAFDEFRKAHTTLNANQLQFLALIEQEIIKSGGLEVTRLFQQPFTSIHTLGLDGVFKRPEADELVAIIGRLVG